MTTLTINIPDSKAADVSTYIEKVGGKVVKSNKQETEYDLDNEVTHEYFFGENIRRLFKAFAK